MHYSLHSNDGSYWALSTFSANDIIPREYEHQHLIIPNKFTCQKFVPFFNRALRSFENNQNGEQFTIIPVIFTFLSRSGIRLDRNAIEQ